MSKQIEEVMEQVRQAMDLSMRCGECIADPSKEFDEHFESAKVKKASIEAKLRELLPVWQPIESAPEAEEVIVLQGLNKYIAEKDSSGIFWTDEGSLSNPSLWMRISKVPE